MKNWDELRTAYEVAKSGTVTAAADALNIHRATVIRHIDSLEDEMGVKLFQRHGRGYTPTEAGKDLLHVAATAEAEFSQLQARAKGRDELHGEFIVTSLEFIAPLLLPILDKFQQQYPQLNVRYLVQEELVKLEYGQAHIAIRSGNKPDHLDYVVKPFTAVQPRLFAHRDYLAQHGTPQSENDFAGHQFVLVDATAGFATIAINRWLQKHLDISQIALQSNTYSIREHAINHAMGIGVMYRHIAEQYPDLVEICPEHSAHSDFDSWLTTHGDLHRTVKVQRFLQLLTEMNAETT